MEGTWVLWQNLVLFEEGIPGIPGVRGVLKRLITHLLVWLSVLHVCLELEDGCLGAVVDAVDVESILDEGVGGHGCGRN